MHVISIGPKAYHVGPQLMSASRSSSVCFGDMQWSLPRSPFRSLFTVYFTRHTAPTQTIISVCTNTDGLLQVTSELLQSVHIGLRRLLR